MNQISDFHGVHRLLPGAILFSHAGRWCLIETDAWDCSASVKSIEVERVSDAELLCAKA